LVPIKICRRYQSAAFGATPAYFDHIPNLFFKSSSYIRYAITDYLIACIEEQNNKRSCPEIAQKRH